MPILTPKHFFLPSISSPLPPPQPHYQSSPGLTRWSQKQLSRLVSHSVQSIPHSYLRIFKWKQPSCLLPLKTLPCSLPCAGWRVLLNSHIPTWLLPCNHVLILRAPEHAKLFKIPGSWHKLFPLLRISSPCSPPSWTLTVWDPTQASASSLKHFQTQTPYALQLTISTLWHWSHGILSS